MSTVPDMVMQKMKALAFVLAGWLIQPMSMAGALGRFTLRWTPLVQPWCWEPQPGALSLGPTILGAG